MGKEHDHAKARRIAKFTRFFVATDSRGQPDGSWSRLAVPQEKMAVMPCQDRVQSAGFLPGEELFATAPPVPPDMPARIAAFRAIAIDFGFPHDHRQDRRRPVGGNGRRLGGGEPLLVIPACDGPDRLPPEPGKDLVIQVPAIDPERARFPVSGITAEDFLRDVLEKGFCGDFRRTERYALPERCQMGLGDFPGFGQLHHAGIVDGRPHALPVVLGVNEKSPATGRQDPDAETAEFRVADFTN